MRVDLQCGSKMGAMLGVLSIARARLWGSATKAETHVYLLRGWFGVFSTGLDSLAHERRSKGVKAEAVGHVAWKSTVSNINHGGDLGISHIAMDKTHKIQAEIERAILAVPQTK